MQMTLKMLKIQCRMPYHFFYYLMYVIEKRNTEKTEYLISCVKEKTRVRVGNKHGQLG